MTTYFVCLLIFVVFLSFGSTYLIGTGRGVIKAVQIGTDKYGLEEVSFGRDYEYYYPELSWQLETDPRFPNGQFITSLHVNLVWDCKGYQFVSGTPVVLFEKKNTLVATKNQRWVLSNNSFGIIHNQNMVANVTSDGRVVLAPKSQSLYQKFYVIDIIRNLIRLENYLPIEAHVYFIGPAGTEDDSVFGPGSGAWEPLAGPGNYAIIKDKDGNVLAGPYDVIIHRGDLYRLPPPGPVPLGTNVWTGYMIEEGQEFNVTYTLTFYPESRQLLGYGSDVYGTFEFDGYYLNSGDCVGDKRYPSHPQYKFFHALLDSTGRRLIEEGEVYLKY